MIDSLSREKHGTVFTMLISRDVCVDLIKVLQVLELNNKQHLMSPVPPLCRVGRSCRVSSEEQLLGRGTRMWARP